MRIYNILELNEKLTTELRALAKELGIKRPDAYKKDDLIYKILDQQAILESRNKNSESYQAENKVYDKKKPTGKNAKPADKPNIKAKVPNTPKETPVKNIEEKVLAAQVELKEESVVEKTIVNATKKEKQNNGKNKTSNSKENNVVVTEKPQEPQVLQKEKPTQEKSSQQKPIQLVFRSKKSREEESVEPVPVLQIGRASCRERV